MKKNDLAKKIADEKRRAEEAAAAKGAEAASAVSFHRVPSHTANRRANLHAEEEGEEPKQRSLDDMAHDVVDMMDRFDRVHKGMCAQLSKAGI
jgi:Flp pilus assembly CpaE family ATPase